DSAMQLRYFDYPAGEPAGRRQVIVTATGTVMVWNVLLLIVAWFASEPVMRYFQGPPGSGNLLFLTLAAQGLGYPVLLAREVLRLQRRPWTHCLLSATSSLSWMACSLYFVYWAQDGLHGYVMGSVIAALMTLPIAVWLVRDQLRGTFDWVDLKAMMRIALPLIPAGGAMWLMSLADRMVLNHWVDLAAIGYYGIGQKLTRVLSVLAMAFGTAWSPFIIELHSTDPERARAIRAQLAPIYGTLLGAAAVLFTGLAPELISLIVSPKYLPAAALVGPLTLGLVASAFGSLLVSPIILAKATGYLAVYMGIGGVVNLGLNLLLVPFWGALGSAWATVAGFVILDLLYYEKGQRLIPTPYAAKGLLIVAGVTVLTVVCLGQVDSLLIRVVIVALYLPLIYGGGGVDRPLVKSWISRGLAKWREIGVEPDSP
ncbi:MAG: polysaccharide biosynthesis C-terminal domain-containing protein, partial [Candidatus Sericytochromatia bacterium]|nr:polysaccharide biosynthesis C-terminal domain-containing protein [Candidatus Sericytochromatia bacterium]